MRRYWLGLFAVLSLGLAAGCGGVPEVAPAGLTFVDSDPDEGEIGGTLTIEPAADESNVSHYVVYWGDSTGKLASETALATVAATGSDIAHPIPSDTVLPAGATHLHAFAKNDIGEAMVSASVAIDDVAIPGNAAQGIAFSDTDLDGGELAGDVVITKADDESQVETYNLYWASDESTPLDGAEMIVAIDAIGDDLTYTIAADTALPAGASHLLVITANQAGEMDQGVSTLINDKAIPTHAPQGASFTDSDPDADEVGGTLAITAASDESDVTDYLVYWGSDDSTKLTGQVAVATIAKTGSDIDHTIASDTALPSGATHFLVFTANGDGEMASGVAAAIDDVVLPDTAAQGITFTDVDLDAGEIGGDIYITKATDESTLTDYVIYYGSDATTKLADEDEVASLSATGSDLTHSVPSDTTLPAGATHFLVFTANAGGEMASGVATAIDDKAAPTQAAQDVSFSDTDPQEDEVGGDVIIDAASDETDLTHYVVYWGSDATTKLAGETAIVEIQADGSATYVHTIPQDTTLPSGATHILVFTKNADGEMATGVSVAVTDFISNLPTNFAADVTFADTDMDKGELAGDIVITAATDESDIDAYVIVWSDDGTTQLAGSAVISEITADGSADYTYTVSDNTAPPAGASHFVVLSKNADGTTTTGTGVRILDAPIAADLLISELHEGSSNNKWIEIYNGTGATIDLNNYQINLYSNGNTAANSELVINDSLADDETFVIYHGSVDTAVFDPASCTNSIEDGGVTGFNGNDTITIEDPADDSVIDIIGVIGVDGTGEPWEYTDTLLIRKPGQGPNATWTVDEWDFLADDDGSYACGHTF